MFMWTCSTGSTFSWGRSTRYSDGLHDFSVTIPRCNKDVYLNSFFPRRARLLNSLPIEYFPLTYNLNGFKSRINRHLLTVGSFSRDFLYATIFSCFFFVTPCLVVAVQPYMEWIPIKKQKKTGELPDSLHSVTISHKLKDDCKFLGWAWSKMVWLVW